MKRISLRLFLALITFLIGISVTAFWMFSYSSKSDLDSQPVIEHSVVENLTTQTGSPKFDNGEIEVKYAWSLLGRDSLDGMFVVKNNSGETIYYSGYPNAYNQENQNSWVKQNGKLNAIKIGSPELMTEQELKPNESITFSIPVPQNKKSFEAGFEFRVGSQRTEKIVWVKIKKQLKSYGTICSTEEITQLIDDVAKANCIRVEPD